MLRCPPWLALTGAAFRGLGAFGPWASCRQRLDPDVSWSLCCRRIKDRFDSGLQGATLFPREGKCFVGRRLIGRRLSHLWKGHWSWTSNWPSGRRKSWSSRILMICMWPAKCEQLRGTGSIACAAAVVENQRKKLNSITRCYSVSK